MSTGILPRVARHPASFRLTDEVRDLIAEIAARLGVSQAAVIELAVRKFAASAWVEEAGSASEPRDE